MFLCDYPEQSGQVVVQIFKMEHHHSRLTQIQDCEIQNVK